MFVFELRKQAGWLGTSILLAFVAMAQAQGPRRASVVELLRVLTATGVEVLYSSELVPATLEAPDTLPPDDPPVAELDPLPHPARTLAPTNKVAKAKIHLFPFKSTPLLL